MTSARPAHTADRVLVNGRITTLATASGTPPRAEALAIRSGRVFAVGSTAELRDLIGPATRVIDLEGRTVIPGLIDSHIHVARAGLTWNDELRWEEVRDLAAGLRLIQEAAGRQPPGTWIRVVGGWHPGQLAERRGPTREELDRVAPDHPVFVQLLYDWVLLNRAAMRAVGLTRQTPDPAGGSIDRDEQGEPTGFVRGRGAAPWIARSAREPTLEEQVASTRALSLELNRVGITGVIDGAGIGTRPETYRAIYELWRSGGLTTRVRLNAQASGPGLEREEIAQLVRYAHPRLGDGLLQLLGVGEVVVWALHDQYPCAPELAPAALEDERAISRLLADNGWTQQIHTARNESVSAILDIWEEVDREHPIGPLRWALVHAEQIDERNLRRVKALGIGLLIQSGLRFIGEGLFGNWSEEQLQTSPPFRAIFQAGVPVGAGTDAMRGASYHPFQSLHWYVTGEYVSGRIVLAEEHLLSREDALRLYTLGSAWFSFEEHVRGSLEPGKLADLAVLTDDYFTVPADQIPRISSVLTLVGGQPVYAAGPYDGVASSE